MKKLLLFGLMLFSATSVAHFTHFEPRIIHLYQQGQDTVVLMRMPLPLILLDEHWKGIDSHQPLPLTTQTTTSDGVDYLLDHAQIRANPDILKTRIARGYSFRKNNGVQAIQVEAIHIFNTDTRQPFNNLESALDNFDGNVSVRPDAIRLFDSGVDVAIRLPLTSVTQDEVSIYSVLGDKFNAIHRLANIVTLHRGDNSAPNTTVGILDYSSSRQPSMAYMLMTAFNDGLVHILIGLDHVVFVVLLFFCASSFWRLLSLATAFTIGHSFSLIFGHNLAVTSELFVPGIELLIAMTISVSAIALLKGKANLLSTTPMLIIGTIHGFGFSFVFNELKQSGVESTLSGLLAFNLGIEAGQILIYLLMFWLNGVVQQKIGRGQLQRCAAIGALLITSYWIVTRSIPLIAQIEV